MKRTLYIHIGAHRTATTSIQRFMKANFMQLQRRGYLIPFGAGRHFGLVNSLFSGAMTIDEAAADLNARADKKKTDIHSIVLSDEDICMRRNLTLLAEFRGHFEVRIVFSMRRQDLWLESWHQQNVKWQWNPELAHLTFEAFMARRDRFFWIHYDAVVQHLEKLFGADALSLMVFEKSRMPEGPVAAFCDAIGLADRTGLAAAPHINLSLSPLMSEFMRTLPLDEFPGPERRLWEQACRAVDEARRKSAGAQSALLMGLDVRRAVLAEYEPGNAVVARRYFDRDALFGDPLPAADAPLALQTLPADSYETIRSFVAPMMREIVAKRLEEAEQEQTGTNTA